ncbi:MAG: neutral/alkaline non-lysosomal ceramidase N-terminal domain-containing protein [Lentisphaeria bacterium]
MKAGFASYEITPRAGVELSGFGPFRLRHSIAIRDRLEARAAAFMVQKKMAVLICCDLIGLSRDLVQKTRAIIRQNVATLTDADIMLSCSHTHSGPATAEYTGWGEKDLPYLEILPYKIAQAGINACLQMQKVELSTALVACEGIGVNREYGCDTLDLVEVLKESWRPTQAKLTDTSCRVIKFTNETGEMKGFMAYFGCHPVVCSADCHYIHGDYPGIAMRNLMREFPGSIGLFLQGAQGDVNSCVVHKPEQDSLLALDIIAGRFARAVRQGLQQAQKMPVKQLKTAANQVNFSTNPVFTMEHLQELQAEKEKILHHPEADDQKQEVRMAMVQLLGIRRMQEFLRSGQKTIAGEVQLIRLGPLDFLGSPFEIMQAIKNDVLAAAQAPIPLVMGQCNGSNGYAPDKQCAARGGYATDTVPLINGMLPYRDIHSELLQALLELERQLNS